MKVLNYFKNMHVLEIVLAILFVLFIVLPIEVPDLLAYPIDTTFGIVCIFTIAVYMFYNMNYVLAVLFIFVAYELLNRSSKQTGKRIMMEHTPSQEKKNTAMKEMNPDKKYTLEEEVINKMAPINKKNVISYISSSYSPLAENIGGASKY